MLFANAVFNVFDGVFDLANCVLPVLSYVRQNVAAVLLLLCPIIRCELCLCRSVWCYVNFDSIIRVSNYVLLNPGLPRARPLWSGASDKLIMHVFPAEREFMLQGGGSC